MSGRVLGVILAGGRSRRFGSPKAFAHIGGARVIDRVVSALRSVTGDPVLVANDTALFAPLGLQVRKDLNPGHGPLGGVETALTWAIERGANAALVVACDLPCLSTELLRALANEVIPGAAVVPESTGPLGFEPLCAAYGVGCLDQVRYARENENDSMAELVRSLPHRLLPLSAVRVWGDPDDQFLNVNRPEDLVRAERLVRAEEQVPADASLRTRAASFGGDG